MKSVLSRAKALSRIPFVRGVATFQVGGIVMAGIGFIQSIIYARMLGVSQFGLYAAVTAFVGFVTILVSYGQETSTATFLAEAAGRKDKREEGIILRYFLQATAVSFLVYILLFAACPFIAEWTGQTVQTGNLARVLLINSFLQWPNVLLFIVLQIRRRIALVTLIENVIDILQVALATILLILGWGVMGILTGMTVVTALAAPVLLWMYDKNAKEMGMPRLLEIVKSMGKRGTGVYVRQGLWIALDTNIGKNIYPNLFYMVLTATTSLQTVGVFRIAFRLATLPLTVVLPSISRMATYAIPRLAASDPKNLLRSCKKVLIGTVGISALACLGAAVIAPLLIPVVYGQAYVYAIPVFLALLPINIISATQVITVPLLRVYRRVWFISIVNVVGIILGIGSYFLAHLVLPTLAAISCGVLIFQVNTLVLFPYLYHLLRKKKLA